jgi:hypothetical protein
MEVPLMKNDDEHNLEMLEMLDEQKAFIEQHWKKLEIQQENIYEQQEKMVVQLDRIENQRLKCLAVKNSKEK